jgi:pyruvate dehydrogenase E1 component alpha subunit
MTLSDIDISQKLFYKLLKMRMIEDAIAEKYSKQNMRCPVHFSIGQEAIGVGVCEILSERDYVLSCHRSHVHYLAKGGSLSKLIAEIMGKETGCCLGRGGSMHLTALDKGFIASTAILGGTMPVGVGVAFANQYKKEDRITTIFFGDGSTEEGVWTECLNFAALKKLSILFVCENNFYSVCSPLSVRQSIKRDRILIAKAHGLWTKKGYGNDVEEVYQIAKEAREVIKNEGGPVFLEFDTYRYKEHCGPNADYHENYRPLKEIEKWLAECPLKIFEKKYPNFFKTYKNDILIEKEKIQKEIESAFQFAEKSPFSEYKFSKEEIYAK